MFKPFMKNRFLLHPSVKFTISLNLLYSKYKIKLGRKLYIKLLLLLYKKFTIVLKTIKKAYRQINCR